MATINLTLEYFKENIFDFTTSKEWKFKGDRPAIIDFYAGWCGPCKMIAPVLEELANEYDGKIDVYKVDTEKETELSSVFQIRSIPSILFVPNEGVPKMQAGVMSKSHLITIIESDLLSKTKEVSFKDMMNSGARVVDVRSPEEFQSGHVEGSLNIPLDAVQNNIDSIKELDAPVILVCRSGGRASLALNTLKALGVEVYNAGAWENLI